MVAKADLLRAIAALALASLVAATVDADASRQPKPAELRAIKRAAMKDCRSHQEPGYGCKWAGGVRVSTANSRYAWANVNGPNYDNSGLLRRPTTRSRLWRMIRVVGGGIQPCSYWYAVAPRKVIRDLKIQGFTEGSGDFSYRRC